MKRFFVIMLIIIVTAGITATVTGIILRAGPRQRGDNLVGLVKIKGIITDARENADELQEMARDPKIKGIIVRINSPGGAVAPSQEIYAAIRQAALTKPVYASLGTVAASGGYYAALGANRIFANPGTITGSIGVIMQATNWERVLDKIGLQNEVIKSGPYKDIGSPLREMTAEEHQLLQALIDDVYRQFTDAVGEHRGLSPTELESVADGRILSGAQAHAARLVDELGTLHDAVAAMGRELGFSEPPEIVERKEKRGLIPFLLGERLAARLTAVLADPAPAAAWLLPGATPFGTLTD